jgi:hypothetical protein
MVLLACSSPALAQAISPSQAEDYRRLDRERRDKLEQFRREHQERANQATRERNRAVQEGAERARRDYYGAARGSSSRDRSSPQRYRTPPLVAPRGVPDTGLSRRCRRWLALCRQGRRSACRRFDENC